MVFLGTWAVLLFNWLFMKIPVLNIGTLLSESDMLPPIDASGYADMSWMRKSWNSLLSWETKTFYSSFTSNEMPYGTEFDSAYHISRTFPAWRNNIILKELGHTASYFVSMSALPG